MFTAVLVVAAMLTLAGGLFLVLGKNHTPAMPARGRRRPDSVPAWLWERMLELDVSFSEVAVVQLIGRPGDGKSVLLANTTEFLSGYHQENAGEHVRLVEASAGLSKVLKDLKNGKWSAKTAPADPNRPEEYLIVKVGDRLVAVVSQPGDILRCNDAVNPVAARQLFGADDQLGVVFNAFRYDQAIATKALLGLIATLQAPPLNYDVAQATLVACDLLFGMGAAAVQEQELDWEEIGKYPGAKVVWEPASAGADGKFGVRLAAEGDPGPLLRAVKNLAHFAVRQDLDVINMRQLIRQCPGVLVVLTRLDLLPLIPALGEADFARVFDDAFGPASDYWASQRVLARNVRLVVRPDAKRPIRIAELDPAGGKSLWSAITRVLGRRRAAARPVGERVADAAVRSLPALATVVVFAVVSRLIAGAEVDSVWTWAALAVLAWGTLTALLAIRWPIPKPRTAGKAGKRSARPPQAPPEVGVGEMAGAAVNRLAARNGAPVS